MDLPVNALAESRVLVSWEHSLFPNTTTQNSSGTSPYPLFLLFLIHQLQLVLNRYLGGNSNQTGPTMVMSGKPGGGFATQTPLPGDYTFLCGLPS
jgi:hypothetical protein